MSPTPGEFVCCGVCAVHEECICVCRVFTFGIGSGASTALVNGLAKAGNGTAEFIKEGERMQPKVRCRVIHVQHWKSTLLCMHCRSSGV